MPKVYEKSTWTDEELLGDELYNILETNGSVYKEQVKIELDTDVLVAGTPLTAQKMNNIEGGISAIDTKLADLADMLTTSGTSTGFIVTTVGNTPLSEGERWTVKFHVTAGVAPTIKRDENDPVALKYFDSAGVKQSCSSSQILANVILEIVYDGTDYVIKGGTGSSDGTVDTETIVKTMWAYGG